MRLDKFLTDCFLGTRSEVKKLIKNKQIEVNDKIITNDSYNINPNIDKVVYQNQILKYQEYHYYLMNKPSGYITATKDNFNKTIMELFSDLPSLLVKRLFPIGRLDKDTEGLLLITDDGEFAHQIMSPNYEIEKTYYVEYTIKLKEDVQNILKEEIKLNDGTIFKPSKIKIINDNSCYLTITEGKFHEVKRIINYLGSEVTYLKRVKIGNLSLEETLEIGKYQEYQKKDLINKIKNN